ncbi:MAG: hypothetical protein ACYTG0_01495 [Planctomycetota bacterium]|jgi:hypothetical protein
MMSSEVEKVLKKEKGILGSSPTIHLVVAGACLLFGIVLFLMDIFCPVASRVGAGAGLCFGVSAIAFVNHLNSTQSKLNLEIVKAIRELQARCEKGD